MSTLPNRCLSSTTFAVEEVKIRRPAGPKAQRERSEHRSPGVAVSATPLRGWRGLKRLDWRKPVPMRLRYSHGRDPYVVVEARGREWAYPWDMAVLDILRDVANRDG